ncbi:hypothetical protein PFISCL1PPCAC_540, partial [Pristionchus fissidentatus]
MAMAKDARLKQLMVYRLEEQLRVISQDDAYSQILAVLSRCVQSLLVPKKEKGHDGSGDATSIDPFATLDKLLLDANRSPDLPSKDKLLVLLADSLSVVFSTIDDLKPSPVSRAYLNSVVEEELAIAAKTKEAFESMSSASGMITHISASSNYTDSRQNTVSTAQSSASAVSTQQQSWSQQPANAAAPATPSFGTHSAAVPEQQHHHQHGTGFGTQSSQSNASFTQPQQQQTASFGTHSAPVPEQQQHHQQNSGFGTQSSQPNMGFTQPQ